MKKIAILLMIFALMQSCKKETEINITKENTAPDSLVSPESNEISEPAFPFQQVEFSASQATDYLKPKQNDTLYVTNFFATWCGPCMREIPHFKEKMQELTDKPVKFTFVSLDEKSDWNTALKAFAEKENLSKNIVVMDGSKLTPDFFKSNFKSWDGGSIPFTIFRKGSKTEEFVGMMSKLEIDEKINSFLASNESSTSNNQTMKVKEEDLLIDGGINIKRVD